MSKSPGDSNASLAILLVNKLIGGYQLLLSPFLGRSCRFYPSCSAYGKEAVNEHGVVRGLALLAWRVGRCHPWSAGGYDPVPAKSSSQSSS